MFKPYQSKPITRMALQIDNDSCFKIEEATWEYDALTSVVRFKAYEPPQLGDWIVRLTDEDTYHVTDVVFRERNVVEENPQ